MKLSTPSPTHKFPPPLMKFLNTNGGVSTHRLKPPRSRSSPMFVRRKPSAIETLEPSSPTVTCMGQVRARTSKSRPRNQTTTRPRRHRWNRFRNSFRSAWRKWVLFLKLGFPRKSRNENEISKLESQSNSEFGENTEYSKDFESISSPPPENGVRLTRCRSAPYKSSSLAYKFWGSPSKNKEEQKTEQESKKPDSENSNEESKIIRKSGNFGISLESVILRRSKSLPARTTVEKFDIRI